MRKARPIRGKSSGQEGYALVLVVFLLALIVITLATVTPNILVNGRRDKEEEMIWRGKQYVRGIRLFVRYNQMHGGQIKFPTSLEDLTKNKVGIRFMRQEYKDPMNHVDGSWRFVYVGPNGQLIGSLKPESTLAAAPGGVGSSAGGFGSLFGGAGQPPTAATGTQGSSFGNSSFGNSSFGNSSFGGSSSGNSSFGNSSFGNSSFNNNGQVAPTSTNPAQGGSTGAQNGTAGDGTDTQTGKDWGDMATPQAVANADVNMTVVGGNIIGVGSKVNQKSIIWYEKAKNYRQFEFIWDPSKEPLNGGTNAGVVGFPPPAPQGGPNSPFSNPGGNTGFGQQPGGFGSGNPGMNPGQGQSGSPDQPPPGTQTPPPQ